MATNRLLALAIAVLSVAGCGQDKPCRPGTFLVSFAVPGSIQLPADFDVTVTTKGADKLSRVTLKDRETAIEVHFPGGYPVGDTVSVLVAPVGVQGSSLIGTVTAAPSCTALRLAILEPNGDGFSPPDQFVGPDFAGADFAGCVAKSCDELAIGCGSGFDNCGMPISCGACILADTAPIIAQPNQTLILEGRFADSAIVQFPGGATATGDVLGPNRVRVVVPDTATAGDLTVQTGGGTTNAVKFMRTAYTLGLAGPFQHDAVQTLFASTRSDLDVGRDRAAAISTDSYVYVIGGQSDSGALATIVKSRRSAEGSLLGFVQSTSSLMTARRGHAALRVAGRVYVVGGSGDTGALSSVESAAVQSDGTLGPFATDVSTLVQARESFASTVIGKYVYVFGGLGPSGETLDTVERALVRDDGGLGPFVSLSGKLTTQRSGASAMVLGDQVIVIGGATASADVASVGADGTIGAFAASDQAGKLTAPRQGFGFIRLGSQVAVVGGTNGSSLATIETATIDSSNKLGNFATAPQSLMVARRGLSLVANAGRLFVLGGFTGAKPEYIVEHIAINASGLIGNFAAYTGGQLNVQRSGAACAVIGDHLYVIGGPHSGPENDVESAPIVQDGKLGNFTAVGSISGVARSGPSLARDGYNLYVVGGSDAVPQTVTIASHATIPEDGESVSAFSDVATGMGPSNKQGPVTLESRTYFPGTTSPNDKLAVWNSPFSDTYTEGSVALTTPRSGARAFSISDHLYVLGGSYKSGTTMYPTSIERSIQGTGPSTYVISSFENAGDLPAGRRNPLATFVGSTLYVMGGANSSQFTDVVSATVNATSQLSSFGTVNAVTTSARPNGGCAVQIGNYVYLIGQVTSGSPWIEVARLQ